jgi:hypothetical protein
MDAAHSDGTEPARSGGRPAEQLDQLLRRAENGRQAALLMHAEVRSALMHYCGLQSCRHTKGPPRRMNRRTYRHSFLLPDGDVQVLWELEHNTGPDEGVVHRAVFADREDLTLAEWEVDSAFGGFSGPADLSDDESALSAPPFPAGAPDVESGLLAASGDAFRRAYTEGDSAEHAWRLLRRATNAGAPGTEMRARLRAAIAHDISIVTRRSAVVGGRQVSWALYEHAFLLLDGSEVSLWEIDHTRTPTGDPVCEVFTSQDAALDTAVRRIEAT